MFTASCIFIHKRITVLKNSVSCTNWACAMSYYVSEIHKLNPPPNSPCIRRDTAVHSILFGIMSNTAVSDTTVIRSIGYLSSFFCFLPLSRVSKLTHNSSEPFRQQLPMPGGSTASKSIETFPSLARLLPVHWLACVGGEQGRQSTEAQIIHTLIGMLLQTLIVSRLDQLSQLGARIQFFHYS